MRLSKGILHRKMLALMGLPEVRKPNPKTLPKPLQPGEARRSMMIANKQVLLHNPEWGESVRNQVNYDFAMAAIDLVMMDESMKEKVRSRRT